jgi:hypothetical protein
MTSKIAPNNITFVTNGDAYSKCVKHMHGYFGYKMV